LIFLSPPRERIEVRGNDPRAFFHPHPDPLPSREREIKERVIDRSVRSLMRAGRVSGLGVEKEFF
jgi:hypothetical protein